MIEVNLKPVKEKPEYPKLMALKSDPEYVVLFYAPHSGIKLSGSGVGPVGYNSTTLDETFFVEYFGEIVLRNK